MLIVLTGATAAGAAVTAGPAVTIRVYDAASLDPATVAAALTAAEAALSAASVNVRWKRCRHDAGCDTALEAGERAVRFVRKAVPRDARGVLPLGEALVDGVTGSAVLATVYVDRVEWLARTAGGDAAALLGRAVAHEIGHLLMATNAHSGHGLMRAVWSQEEIRGGRRADWTFADRDVAAIQARLRGLAR